MEILDLNQPEEPQEPQEPPVPEFVNKLTGEETTEELAGIRPIAMMINNIKAATPQQGISLADVMYEVLAEGGITRLLCLFTDYASLPETGSIRSSRDYFIDLRIWTASTSIRRFIATNGAKRTWAWSIRS